MQALGLVPMTPARVRVEDRFEMTTHSDHCVQ
ncbi:MAG: hypothetical protein K0R17_1709 [Rariglobus sp.]|nr:hypothetical protein [Rariglobus sp.]